MPLVEEIKKQNSVRNVHCNFQDDEIIRNRTARDTPTSVVVESSESDKNSDKHLRQLKKSDGLGRPRRNSNSIGSQGIVRVHERVDKEVHTTEDDPRCIGRVQTIHSDDKNSDVVVPVEE